MYTHRRDCTWKSVGVHSQPTCAALMSLMLACKDRVSVASSMFILFDHLAAKICFLYMQFSTGYCTHVMMYISMYICLYGCINIIILGV